MPTLVDYVEKSTFSKDYGVFAYSYPRVIHRSEESPEELLPAASVNNSAAKKLLP